VCVCVREGVVKVRPVQIMLQNTMPVFTETIEKPRFQKSTAVPIVNGNGNGNGARDHSPPPKLQRVTEGSKPISMIADRVIRRSYGEFLNLAETYAMNC